MNIGTAKPNKQELAAAPHHLIDICEANETYSAQKFCDDAKRAVAIIEQKGKIPLFVGGTMLYFHALEHGLLELPGKNEHLRQRLEKEARKHGTSELHTRLSAHDPKRASAIHPNDKVRLIRALEIFDATQKTWDELRQMPQVPPLQGDIVSLALKQERHVLHERVGTRFHTMLEKGLVEEVAYFFNQPERFANTPAMRSVGYQQVWSYLAGEIDKDTMTERALSSTRQLVKRQCTWLKSWPCVQWFDAKAADVRQTLLESIKKLLY